MASDEDPVKQHLERLLLSREYPKTICPSEVARAMSGSELQQLGCSHWRELMPSIRERLWDMRDNGQVEILQKGIPLPEAQLLEDVNGPIRARRKVEA
jgi:hypothetical protein